MKIKLLVEATIRFILWVDIAWIVGCMICLLSLYTNDCNATDKWFKATSGNSWGTLANWYTDAAQTVSASELPRAIDSVFFDAESGNCATASTNYCLTLNMSLYTGIFSGNNSLSILGSLNIGSGTTWSHTGQISMSGANSWQKVTTNGVTLNGYITFSGSAGTWTLMDNLTCSSSITHSLGTLDFNGKTVSCLYYTSTAGSRTLNMNGATLTCTNSGAGNTSCNISGSNLTLNTNSSSVINITGAYGTYYCAYTFNGTLNVTGVGINSINIGSSANISIYNVTRSVATSTGLDVLQIIAVSGSLTVTGTLTITGNSSTNRMLVCGGSGNATKTYGTTKSIVCNGTLSVSNVDFMDISASGSASWDLSAITGLSGDCLGNSGITFTARDTLYWVGNSGNYMDAAEWSYSSGGSGGARIPLPQDSVVFDNNSFNNTGYTVTIQPGQRSGRGLYCSVGSDNPNFSIANGEWATYGNITLTGVNTGGSSTQNLYVLGRGIHTFTPGVNFAWVYYQYAPGGTYNLMSIFTTTATAPVNALNVKMGSFYSNNYSIYARVINSDGTFTRLVDLGTSTITLKNNNSIMIGFTSTGLTYDFDSCSFVVDQSGTVASSANFGNLIYNNIEIKGSTTLGLQLKDGFTCTGEFKCVTKKSLVFENGKTFTFNGTFNVSGVDASNLVTITSLATPTKYNFIKAGDRVCTDYLSVTDCAASGSDWYIGANSTSTNCTGLNTSDCPTLNIPYLQVFY